MATNQHIGLCGSSSLQVEMGVRSPRTAISTPEAGGGADKTVVAEHSFEKIKARSALMEATFSSAYFWQMATDEQGVIQIFNVGAEAMLGYDAVDVVDRITPADISDPDELINRAAELSAELDTPIAPGFEALVFKAKRGIEDSYELTYVRKDGSRFPAIVSVTALRDAQEDIIGYLLIGTDNTAAKARSALSDAIVNSAYFWQMATDASGVIQIFNVGAEAMLGYDAVDVVDRITPADISDPDELINRAAELSAELDTPIAPGFEALVFKAKRGIEDSYELTYVRKDGSRFPAIVSVTALRDAQEDIIGYLLIGTDNTARKEVEAAQALLDKQLSDLLENRKWTLEAEVEERTAELQAANKAIRGFLAVAAHDLRTPLTSIVGYSELLIENSDTVSEADRKKFLASIDRQSHNMSALVDDLLTTSSIEDGRLSPSPEVVVLREAIDRCLEMGRKESSSVSVSCPANLSVRVDAIHLGRILDNCVQNAFKYGQPPVRIEATQVGGRVEVRILDHGPGVPSEFVPRMFDKFARADTAATRAKGGTGLGLSIVRGLVEANEGQVRYEPIVPHGSCFVVQLPAGEGPGE
jgi:PAS domain S-box-containing protein